MSARLYFVSTALALIVAACGCARRVQQPSKRDMAKAKGEKTPEKKAPSKAKPAARPMTTMAPKPSQRVVPSAGKMTKKPEAPPKKTTRTAPTAAELTRALEAEERAHSKTKSDLLIMTNKYADAERQIQRLKAEKTLQPTSAPKKAAVPASELVHEKLLALGKEAYDQDDYKTARRVLEILMDLGYKGGYAYYMLARSYAEVGRPDDAVDYYKMACDFYEPVEPKPKYYLYALNNLGVLLRKQARYHEARIVYERAQFVDRDYAPAHYNLGVLYGDYLDDKRRAIEHYQKYLDLRGERTAEVQERIHKLREELKVQEPK